jgi:hypothetical protein
MSHLSSPPTEHRLTRLERLRTFSRVLDSAIGIPGTRFRFGLDPLLGLIPGGGDTLGLFFSCLIVLEASRLGASKAVLGQMASNILLETLVGTVPVLGDLFDATWKSNNRNIKLLDEHLNIHPSSPAHRNRAFTILLFVGLGLVFLGCIALSAWVLQSLYQWLVALQG